VKTWTSIHRGYHDDNSLPPETDIQEEPPESEEASTALVPIAKLLPDVRVSTNALVVHRQRQQLYSEIVYSYSQAHRRVQELEAAAKRQIDEQHKSQTTGVQVPNTQALATLTQKKTEIAILHNQDALDDVRAQLGLDQIRDDILDKLRKNLSFERGLERLSAWTQHYLGRPCDTIREANELFPDLTLSELSFFAVLKRLPNRMLLYGTTFDAIQLARQAGIEDFDASARRQVPQQLWATVHGLTYVLDNYQPEIDDTGTSETDAYAVLGFTGIRENVEFAEYNSATKQMVRNLVPLLLSNARLYEKVWQNSPESLQVGFGRIARVALERTMGDDSKEAASVGLSVAIDTLTPKQRQLFEDERQCLEQTVVQASVYDLARDTMLRAHEVVRLVGILSFVPRCLVQEQPFTGFIQPYGASLKFITPDGNIVEQCPLSPMHGREAMETIQSEIDDVGRENRTIAHLFGELFASVQGDIMDKFSEDEKSLSLLEATALKVWVERGVVLQPLPTWSLVPISDFWRDMLLNYVFTNKDVVARVTSKIGLTEARQIAMTLQLTPPELLEQVKRVVKTPAIRSISALMTGMVIGGCYDHGSQTVTLMEFSQKPYGNLRAIDKAAHSFTLLHECGEAVWTMLDDDTCARWKKISWEQSRRQLRKHFLTFYAHHKDEKEDFCDHFAAYILHGPEFRVAAASAGPLKRKYHLLQQILATLTGSPIEYPRFVPWTIPEIHGALQQEIERMKLEDAIATEERSILNNQRESSEHIFEIRQTFEEHIADEQRVVDAEDIEDPVERQIAEQNDEADDEDYQEDVQTKQGFINMHEVRESVTEVLESVVGQEERHFHALRDTVTECLLEGNWAGIEDALYFLTKDDQEEAMHLLKQVEIKPQKLY